VAPERRVRVYDLSCRNRKKAVLVVAALIEQEGPVLVAQRRLPDATVAWEFPGKSAGRVSSQPGGAKSRRAGVLASKWARSSDVVFFAYDTFESPSCPCIEPRFARECCSPPGLTAVAWIARAELASLPHAADGLWLVVWQVNPGS